MKYSMILGSVLGVLLATSNAHAESKATNHWLLDAESDEERFHRVEQMFAGFSAAMVEVSARYQHTYDAIDDENYKLASYHWDKLKTAIELGYLRRPARADNANKLFIDSAWSEFKQQLDSKDKKAIQQSFQRARSACMACHVAEEVPFMNDQPLFRQTAEFKP